MFNEVVSRLATWFEDQCNDALERKRHWKSLLLILVPVFTVMALAAGGFQVWQHFEDQHNIAALRPYFGDQARAVYYSPDKGRMVIEKRLHSNAERAKQLRRDLEYRRDYPLSYTEFSGYTQGFNEFQSLVEENQQLRWLTATEDYSPPLTCLDLCDRCS